MVVAVRIVDPVVELCLEGEGKPVPVLHEEMVKLVLLPHKEEGKPVLVLQEEALKLVLLCRKEEGLLVLDSRELVRRQLKELPTKAEGSSFLPTPRSGASWTWRRGKGSG